jgi:hypothetical protein
MTDENAHGVAVAATAGLPLKTMTRSARYDVVKVVFNYECCLLAVQYIAGEESMMKPHPWHRCAIGRESLTV